MGSQATPNGASSPGTPKLPTITLDRTLAELYHSASPRTAGKCIGQILGGINSITRIGLGVPRNAKYLYQDKAFNTTLDESPETPGTEAVVRRELSMKYLSLIPQRDAFISGATPVVFFRTGRGPKRLGHDSAEIESTISVLDPSQRPRVVICNSPDDIPVEDEGIDMIACKLMLDGLEKYDLVVAPDTHWFLNSKAALAESGLPTPRSDVIDVLGHAGDGVLCCEICRRAGRATERDYVIPTSCEGARGRWLEAQSRRIYELIADRPLPFVLKNQQTFGGAGTFMVRTEEERAGVVADFRDGVLRRLLSCITGENAHLRPGSLIFSNMVAEPVGDYGVTFFVREEGDPVFLAASEQMIADGNAWVGSSIDYRRQDELERKFGKLVRQTAAWLRSHKYVGPAGADVLETAEPARNGENGDVDEDMACYSIVDLNVRTSGSLCLPLLKTHFTSRGLYNASSFSISLKQSREEFMRDFHDAFESGKMCILSWYQDPDTKLSMADVAVGAEDSETLKASMKKVRDATDEVIF